MLYAIIQEKPGLLVKVYRCLNLSGYKIGSHHLIHNKEEGLVAVKLTINQGEVPVPIDVESELLNIDGCMDLMYEEPDWSAAPRGSSIEDDESLNKKLNETADQVINNFDKVEAIVHNFSAKLDKNSAPKELFRLGLKVGSEIYQNEYALGKPLDLEKTLKRMLATALKKFGKVSCSERTLTIEQNIFCQDTNPKTECDFTRGFITGFLKNAPKTKSVTVNNYSCRSHGQVSCSFEFH